MKDADLTRLLLLLADSLDLRGGMESGGICRQAARRLLELTSASGLDGCERCGKALTHKSTGRPARFCSSRCRLAAHRETKGLRSAV